MCPIDSQLGMRIANRLRQENIAFEDPFVEYFWNIANWNEAE